MEGRGGDRIPAALSWCRRELRAQPVLLHPLLLVRVPCLQSCSSCSFSCCCVLLIKLASFNTFCPAITAECLCSCRKLGAAPWWGAQPAWGCWDELTLLGFLGPICHLLQSPGACEEWEHRGIHPHRALDMAGSRGRGWGVPGGDWAPLPTCPSSTRHVPIRVGRQAHASPVPPHPPETMSWCSAPGSALLCPGTDPPAPLMFSHKSIL